MPPTLLDMPAPIANDAARKTPIGGFPTIGSLPGKQANNLSAMSANPWGASIWGTTNLTSFAPSSKHLQVDTMTATKFQKTGSGLLVESSTTDDWSAGIKNIDGTEASRPSTRYTDGNGSKLPSERTVASSGRSSTISSNNVDDTPRPPYTSSFTSLSGLRSAARPSSSSSSLHRNVNGHDASSWTGEHYSHSPVDDLPYHSSGSAQSIQSSLPASQTSEDVPFDVFQNSRISPDSARLISSSHSSRMSNNPTEQQLAMQFGHMGFGPGLDTSFHTAQTKSQYHNGHLSSGHLGRFNTGPDPHNTPYADYDGELMSGQSQPYTPFGASFFPGMTNHQGIAEMGFGDYYDGRPASSSSSIGRDDRRDSAHGRELQMLCGPRSAGSDFQAQSRMRPQQNGYRQMASDMRTMPYYNQMAMRAMPNSAYPMTPNSYHPVMTPYSQMPGSAMMSPSLVPDMPVHFDQGQAYRSSFLNEYRAGVKSNKKLDLNQIYGHVVEFSGDQYGSRFIQTKLENASSDEKERIFQEIEPNAMQLMTDVFGNYVIQKLFEHGDQTQKRLLANKMKGQVYNLSTQMYGCRVVQKALQHILIDQQAAIIRELDQSQDILRCVKDKNGNHVIQRAMERCHASTTGCILAAFKGQIMHLSSHAYGCRVIQRCLEYCPIDDKAAIMSELHEGVASLVSDQYGNYVVQHVVEHGSPSDRAAVLDIVKKDLGNYSKHKFASNVVEKCLESADEAWRATIVRKLLECPRHDSDSMLLDLIKDSYGNYVIQKLLDVMSPSDYDTFLDRLHPELNKAKRAGQGKQVQNIERKMDGRATGTTDTSAGASEHASRSQSTLCSPAMMTPTNNYMMQHTIAGAMLSH